MWVYVSIACVVTRNWKGSASFFVHAVEWIKSRVKKSENVLECKRISETRRKLCNRENASDRKWKVAVWEGASREEDLKMERKHYLPSARKESSHYANICMHMYRSERWLCSVFRCELLWRCRRATFLVGYHVECKCSKNASIHSFFLLLFSFIKACVWIVT